MAILSLFSTPTRLLTRALAVAVIGAGTCAQLEPIDRTCWNVRGFNYIAIYRDIHHALGVPEGTPLSDVASAVAMWHGFDPGGATGSQVQAQLRRIKDIGANTVRVWRSFHLYSFRPADMRSRFDTFLGMSDTVGLHVIQVLLSTSPGPCSGATWSSLGDLGRDARARQLRAECGPERVQVDHVAFRVSGPQR